jgi:pilus assembly protein CpaB
MNRRGPMIALALALALVGTGAVYSYLKGADSRVLADKQATSVLIVDKRIPAGTSVKDVIKDGYVRTDKVPAESKPVDALDTLTGVTATDVSLAEMPAGQVVLGSMFGKVAPTTSGLKIPDGMVAVSITVTADADVAGYVQPGAQVAIFDTFPVLDAKGNPSGAKGGGSEKTNWATKLLLPRVLVLAVSQGAPTGTTQAAAAADSLLVTLAVNQIDAERVIHVRQTGLLYLALLSEHSVTAPSSGVDNQGKLGPLFDVAAGSKALGQ